MTVSELIKSEPHRSSAPPESIFEINLNGKPTLMCMASFLFEPEFTAMLEMYPNLMQCEVTKEHFTKSEWMEARAKKGASETNASP